MKILVNKNSLVSQLPDGDLKDWPDVIRIIGDPLMDEVNDPFRKKYKEVFETLTRFEWLIFCELVKDGFAYTRELTRLSSRSNWVDSGMTGNLIAVHIKSMRRKLKGFTITSKRGLGYSMDPHE